MQEADEGPGDLGSVLSSTTGSPREAKRVTSSLRLISPRQSLESSGVPAPAPSVRRGSARCRELARGRGLPGEAAR